MMEQPPLLEDLREFVTLHRPHGELQANASAPTQTAATMRRPRSRPPLQHPHVPEVP
jgi:hypothetical protein